MADSDLLIALFDDFTAYDFFNRSVIAARWARR